MDKKKRNRVILISAGTLLLILFVIALIGKKKNWKAVSWLFPPSGGGKDAIGQIDDTSFPLVNGSRGRAVVMLQLALKHKYGQPITVDGKIGKAVYDALVKVEEKDKSITATKRGWLTADRPEVDRANFDKITAGVDFSKLVADNPQYGQVYKQYSAYYGS